MIDALANVERAVVEILNGGGGRGVLVPGGYILTAAHCIYWDFSGDMVLSDYYENVETADGISLVLKVVAVEPVADIAVLESPDCQERSEAEVEAFEQFVTRTRPVPLYRGEMKLCNSRKELGPGDYAVSVHVLNKDRSWVKATAAVTSLDEPTIRLDPDKYIDGGASASSLALFYRVPAWRDRCSTGRELRVCL
jgi:hypothetical protein